MEKPRNARYEPGSTVIYPLHGRCTVVGVEQRQIGTESVPFYKLEVQKSSFSRSTKPEPAIWVPVSGASVRGLRLPLSVDQSESVLKVLSSREYYFDLQDSWSQVLPKLEACIRAEGAVGLAKVYSYLFVLKKKQIVPSTEVNRMMESVSRQLMRELSEATQQSARDLENQLQKGLRQKLLPDA